MSNVSLKGIVAAAKAAGAKHFGLGGTEPSETIEWRLEVCRGCPKRRRAKTALERASVALGEGRLGGMVCDVCGCNLELLCSATPENQHEDSPEEAAARPKACWKHS